MRGLSRLHLLLVIALLGAPAAAGTPRVFSQREEYRDPLTRVRMVQLTTDGRDAGVINHQGDLSSEASAFSPDSRAVVFAKCCGRGTLPPGVYIAEIATGQTRLLTRTRLWHPHPVFSRDGRDVYFYEREGHRALLQAVSVATGAVRRLAQFEDTEWQEKIEVNADGTLLSIHLRVRGVWHTHVLRPDGAPLPQWDPTIASGDGGFWNPVHPERLVVRRGDVARAWNVWNLSDTSWKWTCAKCDISHASWHPNGELYFTGGYVVNARTGELVGGTGIFPIHPHIHPGDGSLGLDARLTADEAPWFFEGRGRPRLYAPTLRQVMRGDFRHELVAVHYSSYASSASHPHPHWSRDGRYIFFVSDVGSDRDGLPPRPSPKGTGGVDVFIVDLTSRQP